MPGNLIIYKSSAGSGKTHALVKEYLKIVLRNPSDYRHTLAITFTNKAAEEMKDRIIEKLTALSEGRDSDLEEQLRKEGVKGNIAERSGDVLREILHHYSHFYVQTIDSFFHRVIRSFAKELKLQMGYGIEVETEDVLKVVVDKMLDRIGEDEILTGHIESFVFNNIEEDKSWKIDWHVKELSKEVVGERFWENKDSSSTPSEEKKLIRELSADLYSITRKFEADMLEFSKTAALILAKNKLSLENFHYVKSGFMGWLINGIMERKFKIVDKIKEAYEKPDIIFRKKSHPNLEKAISEGLIDIFKKAVDYCYKNNKKYNTARAVLKTIYIQGIFSDVLEMINAYRDENRALLISDLNLILQKITQGSGSPFIYEKAGTYFKNFLIDEFQDTSNFQWKNLIPLVENSLSEKNITVIVGDVKQSIYRWRGGNMKLLKEKVYADLASHRSMIEDKSLSMNYRSKKEIVSFNNSFFAEAPGLVAGNGASSENGFIKDSYADTHQTSVEGAEGGYVRIDFVKADRENEIDIKDAAELRMLEFVDEILKDGYCRKDITVLVRSNSEATRAATLLLENGHSVISEDSQLLFNSPAVKLLVSLLKYICDTKNALARSEALYHYSSFIAETKRSPQEIFGGTDGSLFFKLMPEDFFGKEKDPARLNPIFSKLNLYELAEKLVAIFRLNEKPDAYILRFLDLALEYMNENGSDIAGFIDWWEETRQAHSIVLPDRVDAVRVMTIHKAKGLQNKAVVIPYANWTLKFYPRDMIWASSKKEPFGILQGYLVNANENLEESFFADEYGSQLQMTRLDNLNLLYVAFTRASERLYVIVPDRDSGKVSKLINDVILSAPDLSSLFDPAKDRFEAGSKEKFHREEKAGPAEPFRLRHMESADYFSRLVIRPSHREIRLTGFRGLFEKSNRGVILHETLSRITVAADAGFAVERMVSGGFITEDMKEELRREVEEILSTEGVKEWFSGEWEVRNEPEILLEDGSFVRPDRVMIKGDDAVIADYKTGSKQEEHKRQLASYEDALKKVGFRNVKKFIFYLQERELVEL